MTLEKSRWRRSRATDAAVRLAMRPTATVVARVAAQSPNITSAVRAR